MEKSKPKIEIPANSLEYLKAMAPRILGAYKLAVSIYLPEDEPLREYILGWSADAGAVEKELVFVLRHIQDLQRIGDAVDKLETFPSEQLKFLAEQQRIKEIGDSFERFKKRLASNPFASQAEYDAGIFKEALEIQVADAVFVFREKGYDSFQSGFFEAEPRKQFIDLHNKSVELPEDLQQYFLGKQFELSSETQNDGTRIIITPLEERFITLEEWKKLWDKLAKKMPVIDKLKTDYYPPRHTNYFRFRDWQDNLINIKNAGGDVAAAAAPVTYGQVEWPSLNLLATGYFHDLHSG